MLMIYDFSFRTQTIDHRYRRNDDALAACGGGDGDQRASFIASVKQILAQWPEILRLASSIRIGTVTSSLIL